MQEIKKLLNDLKNENNLRKLQPKSPLYNLASNDYLALSLNKELKKDFLLEFDIEKLGFTSSSSRILATNTELYEDFERSLENAYQKKALLFNNAYQANLGALGALASLKNSFFIIDHNVHASIIDALLLHPSRFARFKHADFEQAKKIGLKHADKELIFVSEGLFSMDGDFCDIKALVKLKKSFEKAYIYIDEAHSFGIISDDGLGLCAKYDLLKNIDFLVLGFSKALASYGGVLLCAELFKLFFINKARAFLYSSVLAPINVAFSFFIFKRLASFKAQRARLKSLVCFAKKKEKKLKGDFCILSLELKDNKKANDISTRLLKKGFYAPAIKRPTVVKPILRLSLNASLNEAILEELLYEIQLAKK